VHRILLDYISFISPTEVKDMAQSLRDHVVHILHTKEGAQIGAWCVTYGSPKDRKALIKVGFSLFLSLVPVSRAVPR
jgi:pumilio family protein 6